MASPKQNIAPSKPIKERVLLVGNGYLGQRIAAMFSDQGAEVEIIDLPEIDITDLVSVRRVVQAFQPTVIMNAAAMTNTNQLEQAEFQTAGYRVNAQGPANLMLAVKEAGAYLIHISTGMMFDGMRPDGQPWTEEDLPEPQNYYAWTKAMADLQLAPFADRQGILITRIHLPLSRYSDPKNLLNKLGKFETVLNVTHSATVVEDYLSALSKLVQLRATGIYNLVNPGTISFWEIWQLLKKYNRVPEGKEARPISKADFDAMIAKNNGAYQANPVMSTQKLAQLGIVIPEIKTAVEEAIRNFIDL